MSRLPFAIGIPLVAALMVAGIGIPMGILFIQADHWRGPDAALIVALGIALAILFGAIALSVMDERASRPTQTGVKASTTGFASTAPQANPRQTGKQEPPSRRGSGGASGSSSDRKRSR